MKVTVSESFSAYNDRRYSRPWGAIVIFNGTKPSYQFVGTYMAAHGDAGDVLVECNVGDVVAFGRKDNRGSSTYNQWYIVGESGSMTPTDKLGAYAHYKQTQGA